MPPRCSGKEDSERVRQTKRPWQTPRLQASRTKGHIIFDGRHDDNDRNDGTKNKILSSFCEHGRSVDSIQKALDEAPAEIIPKVPSPATGMLLNYQQAWIIVGRWQALTNRKAWELDATTRLQPHVPDSSWGACRREFRFGCPSCVLFCVVCIWLFLLHSAAISVIHLVRRLSTAWDSSRDLRQLCDSSARLKDEGDVRRAWR